MLTTTTVHVYSNKVKNTYDLKTCDMMLHNLRNLLFPLLSKYPACVQVLVILPLNLMDHRGNFDFILDIVFWRYCQHFDFILDTTTFLTLRLLLVHNDKKSSSSYFFHEWP